MSGTAEGRNLIFGMWLDYVRYKLAGGKLPPSQRMLGRNGRGHDCWKIISNGACALLGLKQLAATVYVGNFPKFLVSIWTMVAISCQRWSSPIGENSTLLGEPDIISYMSVYQRLLFVVVFITLVYDEVTSYSCR